MSFGITTGLHALHIRLLVLYFLWFNFLSKPLEMISTKWMSLENCHFYPLSTLTLAQNFSTLLSNIIGRFSNINTYNISSSYLFNRSSLSIRHFTRIIHKHSIFCLWHSRNIFFFTFSTKETETKKRRWWIQQQRKHHSKKNNAFIPLQPQKKRSNEKRINQLTTTDDTALHS